MDGCGQVRPMLHHKKRQRQRQPSLRKNGEDWGTRKFKDKFKRKNKVRTTNKVKTTTKAKPLQDELPEWYHRRRSEVNCGKYRRKGRATRLRALGKNYEHGNKVVK